MYRHARQHDTQYAGIKDTAVKERKALRKDELIGRMEVKEEPYNVGVNISRVCL